ncbi:type VI secretion system Vgr family protein [Orrella dioscoreae]|uniref:Probable vgr related protein n=1 Tax=Orrella dioscoreae TaxID=1851544 RepID=A0A1C3K0M9_9BURK|nr:type VI secretion system Vgr family protein [Orrella dioscoreae]SBT25051.1 probable vgr related protein [Orrella dioscoreae]SOE47385.1 probable vgr related protein [Orrella dioscoreae]
MDTSFSPTHLMSAAFTQANRLLDLETPLGANTLLAETLQGVEMLSGGASRLEVSALALDAHIPLASLLGKPVTLTLRTALGEDAPRVWNGHVTEARFEGANGGLARYRLIVEPWLAFLRERRDSFVFQDVSVFEIVDSVFGDYNGQGGLAPQWRWEVKDRAVYAKRSLTIQYRETDFDFVERLLAEEGLFYWVEHAPGDAGHTVVIADHNDAMKAGAQARARFQRADVTESEDTVQQWQARRAWGVNAVRLSSWDYRSRQARPVSAQASAGFPKDRELVDEDYPGQYAYENDAQGDRLAHSALAARQVAASRHEGRGTVRTFAAGQRFGLDGHWAPGDGDYLLLSVRHRARNNFDEQLERAVDVALGAAEDGAEADFYQNVFTAIPASVTYRPATRDGHGARLLPRPTVHGTQTALVVGDEGARVMTDRDHRIRIQFHWQRGEGASARLAHPSGEDNAPARGQSSTWVRVAEAVAGGDWGGNFVPRVGQEVLVQFLHGDIDRPIVVGTLYNGEGAVDAPHNTVQGGAANATGNAPAWFAGEKEAHGHNAVLSGIKTQALSESGKGDGGYNQIVMDDSPGQARLNVSTTQADSGLTLGHHKHQRDNERLDDQGHGAALSTAEAVSVRAGAGLLVSADARRDAQGAHLDSQEAVDQIQAAHEAARSLADAAAVHRAEPEGGKGAAPALEGLAAVFEIVGAKQAGTGGEAAAYSRPHLQFSAPGGIGQLTPADAVVVAGRSASFVAPHVNWAAMGHMAVNVADGLVLFAQGAAPGQGRAVQEQGLRLHAASGPLRIQAQDTGMEWQAQKQVTIASAQGSVQVTAGKRVLATAAGAYLSIEGGKVNLHAPGKVEFRSGAHDWSGPQSASAAFATPSGDYQGCQQRMEDAAGASGGVVAL